MLSKEAQKKILKALGMPEAEINSLVDTDDVKEAEIPAGLKIFKEADFSEALDNHHNSKKAGLKEIFMKDLKSLAGLEYEGKTPEKFLEEFKASVLKDAGQSIDDKVKTRDAKITELQKKLDDKDGEIAKLNGVVSAAAQDAKLLAAFPKERDSKLTDNDYLTLLKTKAAISEEDGRTIISVDGKPLQDEKLNPLSIQDAVPHLFKSFNWLAGEAGQAQRPGVGGDDTKTGAGIFANANEVYAHIESKGLSKYSAEAQAIMHDAMGKNADLKFE